MRHHSTLTCFYQRIFFLGLYATPLCLRPSPYPFRPVFGPVRRTTETSLASGTVHPLPQMSTSIPLSLSTLMWVCTLTDSSWHYSIITLKQRIKRTHTTNMLIKKLRVGVLCILYIYILYYFYQEVEVVYSNLELLILLPFSGTECSNITFEEPRTP